MQREFDPLEFLVDILPQKRNWNPDSLVILLTTLLGWVSSPLPPLPRRELVLYIQNERQKGP